MTTRVQTVVVLVLGIIIGYGICAFPFYLATHSYLNALTLGKIIGSDSEGITQAYYHPEEVQSRLNDIVWDIPTIPAPFVGTVPRPGKTKNAFINSRYFRDERELTIPKPEGVYRIFLTGGSTAFGSGAPTQDTTIGAYLERELNKSAKKKIEVFTFATPGWTSTQERIAIENTLSELDPDLVLSLSGANDIHWALQHRNIFSFQTLSEQFYTFLVNLGLKSIFYERLPGSVKDESVSFDQVAERVAKNTGLASAALKMKKTRYVYFLQPVLAVSKKSLSARERRRAEMRPKDAVVFFEDSYRSITTLLEAQADEHFHFSYISDIFNKQPADNEIFVDSFHFGDKGNEIIARAMRDYLRNLNL